MSFHSQFEKEKQNQYNNQSFYNSSSYNNNKPQTFKINFQHKAKKRISNNNINHGVIGLNEEAQFRLTERLYLNKSFKNNYTSSNFYKMLKNQIEKESSHYQESQRSNINDISRINSEFNKNNKNNHNGIVDISYQSKYSQSQTRKEEQQLQISSANQN